MGTVFINYRRGDTAGEARALYNDLTARFGDESVFMDVDDIALGRDFRQALHERLAQCDLMLVLVGRGWTDAKNESGARRLEDPADFVGLEIEAALKRNIAVTPVLVQGAQMPSLDQLPANLKDFAYRNGFELSHSRWESDVQEMVKRLHLSRATTPRNDPEHSANPSIHSHSGHLHGAAPVATQRIGKRAIAIAAGALTAVLVAAGGTLYFQNYAGEKARLEAEAKVTAAKVEADRVQAELVAARVEREKAAAAQAEKERTAAAQAEQQQLATAKAKAEADADARQAAAKAEADRVQAETRAAAVKARAERERMAQAEREKLAQAERERQANAALTERERLLTAQRAENDRIAQAARLERERAADQGRRTAPPPLPQIDRYPPVLTARVDDTAARARWKAGYFPAPNAGMVLFAMTSSGDPACASYGSGVCLWGMNYEQVDFSKLKPLVCGAAHKAKWGATGYEDPKHWCSLARSGKTAG